jgi:hypothetical protein
VALCAPLNLVHKEVPMTQHTVRLRLNQQQRQLLEQTIAKGLAPDLQGLVLRALREYRAPAQPAAAAKEAR